MQDKLLLTEDISKLISAAESGDDKLVDKLLEIQVLDVNVQGQYGATALILAAENGHDKIVEKLLETPGIDVDVQGQYRSTALIFAALNDHDKVVEKLLEIEGINVNIQDKGGDTALMIAAYNSHDKIVDMLLEVEGIDVNIQMLDGATALMLAAQSGHGKVVEKLLKTQGIDVIIQNLYGETALMLAAQSGHDKVVEKLLKHPSIKVNNSWYLALKVAIRRNDPLIVSLFTCNESFSSIYNVDDIDFDRHPKIVDYLILSGNATISDFKTDIVNPFLNRVSKSLTLLRRADNEELRLGNNLLSRIDVFISSMCDKSLKEETIEKYSGMKMPRFKAVRDLMVYCKIEKILYKNNPYMFINIFMVRNDFSAILDRIPYYLKNHLLGFIIGGDLREMHRLANDFKKNTLVTSPPILSQDSENSFNNRSASEPVQSDKSPTIKENVCVIS